MKKVLVLFFWMGACVTVYGQALSVKKGLRDMLYIPSGSFVSTPFDGSDPEETYQEKVMTNHGFLVSRYEVTNKEYREFVHYVRDSMAHRLLSHFRNNSNSLDWKRRIDWTDPALEPLFLDVSERLNGKRELDTDKLVYLVNGRTLPIYPDTLVWISDFTFSYNEPLVKRYFLDKIYDQYPVVGISQEQAIAFCDWKTTQALAQGLDLQFRLPSNIEWEATAKHLEALSTLKLLDRKMNFGEIRDYNGFQVRNYDADGFYYTAPVDRFGDHGIFNLKGNVAEWTYDPRTAKEDIQTVRGGGWNSIPFYLQTGVTQYYPSTAKHSYIGFRFIVINRPRAEQKG